MSQAPALSNATYSNDIHEPSLEELERELPVVNDGQIHLGDLLSRVVQATYAELTELAETMPNMSDATRKRTLADWVVKTKKQVVKLYALAKWSRDADTVQKCMNITSFLLNQTHQFDDAIAALRTAKDNLNPARLRNHDLLTSLDVLTTGSYRRLPLCIKKLIIPPEPLTDSEVLKILGDVEDAMRYRLRISEITPVEMSRHRIADGRAWFTVPKLFEVAICLRGAEQDAGWFFVHIEFLLTVGGDLTGMQEFPRIPTGIMKRHITDEADARLAFYLPLPPDLSIIPATNVPSRPQLPEGVVDAPLVRLYNFLQIMSLSYQLEILCHQAQRMRMLGWAEYMNIEMTNNRKTLIASYWIRHPPRLIGGRPAPPSRVQVPLVGGTLTVSIVEARATSQAGGGPARSLKARVLADLQQKFKLGNNRSSDEVEGLKFEVKWEPVKLALGVLLPPSALVVGPGELCIDADNLDFESLLRGAVEKHTRAILEIFKTQLQLGPTRTAFSSPGAVSIVTLNNIPALHARLCTEELVIVTIDPRTGKLNLRDSGDLAAAGRSQRFEHITEWLNLNPAALGEALIRLRHLTITDLAEQKAQYLGLHTYRTRNFPSEELLKLGPAARGTLFVQLSNFPDYYLVLVITDEDFRYALISVKAHTDSIYANLTMEDIGWLDVRRIHGDEVNNTSPPDSQASEPLGKQQRRPAARITVEKKQGGLPSTFDLDTQLLRELYFFCCARVAYTKVEQQFKLRGIPYIHVSPPSGGLLSPELSQIQSSLAQSVPALCVQSSDILSGAPAAEAAMPNIKVIPLNWWSQRKAQVVTCVKLKYVQQPMGKTASTSNIIRPSKRIIYDTTEAVVSFLSEDVDTCVDEFLEEWARVSKMVVIAREVAKMGKDKNWDDVRLLSFDLQTVEFAYSEDYTVSITCVDQLSPSGGSFELHFSRSDRTRGSDTHNPHSEAEPFFRGILRHGHGRLAPSLHRLVSLLRDTLPIAVELETIRAEAETHGDPVDAFAKAAGWYRMLYGDSRHALDWRLMTGQRVLILDASHSVFGAMARGSAAAAPHAHAEGEQTAASSGKSPSAKLPPVALFGKSLSPRIPPAVPDTTSATGSTALPAKTTASSSSEAATAASLALQPIPSMRDIISDAVNDVLSSMPGISGAKIVPIDVGVICDKSMVRAVGRALHLRVLKGLKEKAVAL